MVHTSKNKLVIVVNKGMVDSVYCSKSITISEIEVLDLDTTDISEVRRSKLCAKKAKKSMNQIF